MTPRPLPPPLAILWTDYEYDPTTGDRARCIGCGEAISDGRTVRIYPEGLMHYLCWIAASVAAAERIATPPPPRYRLSTLVVILGAGAIGAGVAALAGGAPILAAIGLGWGGAVASIGAIMRSEGL